MNYDFGIKKKVFGGLDADSVTEYITKIKAENNLLKKELVARPESGEDNTENEKLKQTIEELKETIADYKEQVKSLNKRVAELEIEASVNKQPAKASDSKIAIESLNFANHYFTQAVKMAGEVSTSTIQKAAQTKGSLNASLSSLADFEHYIANFKKQINSVIETLDDVSDNFERIKQFEGRQIAPVESTDSVDDIKSGDVGTTFSLVD